ncbi:hypothetical protein SH83_15320 (plasmid) [Lactiplantibacillus plantarum]|nr:hypothetical protein SH83_15320 [Lactiplantibacillus plantarum]
MIGSLANREPKGQHAGQGRSVEKAKWVTVMLSKSITC